MEKFEKLTAVAAPMPASNIDTDIIMPKAFLKRIDKEGVLEGLFHDIRLYKFFPLGSVFVKADIME